jgi:hypothetical protein
MPHKNGCKNNTPDTRPDVPDGMWRASDSGAARRSDSTTGGRYNAASESVTSRTLAVLSPLPLAFWFPSELSLTRVTESLCRVLLACFNGAGVFQHRRLRKSSESMAKDHDEQSLGDQPSIAGTGGGEAIFTLSKTTKPKPMLISPRPNRSSNSGHRR